MVSCMVTTYAADTDLNDMARYNELLSYGLTEGEATQLLKVEFIVDKLENNNLTLEMVDGVYHVLDEEVIVDTAIGDLTEEELIYITELFQYYADAEESIEYEAMVADVELAMEKNPGQDNYRITYDNGAWIEAHSTLEKVSDNGGVALASERTVLAATSFQNGTFPNEEEDESAMQVIASDGTYSYTYELELFAGVYYAQCYLTETATFYNNGYDVQINSINGGRAAAGCISIAEQSRYINVNSSSYNENPRLWCEAVQEVAFTTSSAIGLSGIFSFSVDVGATWTQYAIIRTSITAFHAYAAYYTMLD